MTDWLACRPPLENTSDLEGRQLSTESAQLAPDTVPGDCFVPGTHLNAGLSKLRVEE